MDQIPRSRWQESFQNIGILPEEFNQLSQEEFEGYCQFILESGLPCPGEIPESTIRESQQKKPIKRKSSQQIRSLQNHEFEMAQIQMLQKEEEIKQLKELEEERMKKREEEQLRNKQNMIDALKTLDPEPADGVPICVKFPSGSQKIRKFLSDHLCDELFTFVEGQEEMFYEDNIPVLFTLTQIGGKPIERGKTFKDVGITRRTMVTVVEEDIEEEDDS